MLVLPRRVEHTFNAAVQGSHDANSRKHRWPSATSIRPSIAACHSGVNSKVNEHLGAQHGPPSSSSTHAADRGVIIAEQVVRIDVHKDRLIVRFKSAGTEEGSHSTDGELLSIPWQKPPSRKSRQILIPLGVPRNEVHPIRIERRARLINAIVRGRRWLDEIVSGSANNIEQIATRQKCSVRQVNMTISLAFLAPDLVKAAVEGRLPRGIGVERLRDAPAEWSRQFEALGLNPQ